MIGSGGSSGGINNLVEDTTPQLGGNLDVNNFAISSSADGDIEITPNGSGRVGIKTSTPSTTLDVEGDGALLPAPNTAIADGDFANSQWSMWLDETNNEFELKAKKGWFNNYSNSWRRRWNSTVY